MKKLFVLLLMAMQLQASAQVKKFEHGVQFGVLKRANSLRVTPTEAVTGVVNKDAWGLGLGYDLYYLSTARIGLRFSPGISFEHENLIFSGKQGTEAIKLDYCYLQAPLHALISLHENSRYRVVAGFTRNMQLLKQYSAIKEKLDFNENDFSLDLGLNYQVYTKFFYLIPEIRFSKPFINAATDAHTDYGLAVDEFYRHKFSFTLHIRPYQVE